jgi:hypothetical protein
LISFPSIQLNQTGRLERVKEGMAMVITSCLTFTYNNNNNVICEMIDPRRRGVDCVRYAAMESVHVFRLSYSRMPPTSPAHVPMAHAKWVHFHIY